MVGIRRAAAYRAHDEAFLIGSPGHRVEGSTRIAIRARHTISVLQSHRNTVYKMFNAAAKTYHRTMLTHFPKVTPHYEHALLMSRHSLTMAVSSMVAHGSWKHTTRCGSSRLFDTAMVPGAKPRSLELLQTTGTVKLGATGC
jgi:calcineurin-like phosphoesterase family protein